MKKKLNKIYLLTKKGEILASIIAHFLSGHLALYMGDSWLAFQSPFAHSAHNLLDGPKLSDRLRMFTLGSLAWPLVLVGHRAASSKPSAGQVFTSKQASKKKNTLRVSNINNLVHLVHTRRTTLRLTPRRPPPTADPRPPDSVVV